MSLRSQPHSKAIVSVRYSQSGSLLATASADQTACIINSNNGEVLHQLKEHSLGLNDCIWIDDSFIATCSDDKLVKIWDVEGGVSTASLAGHKGLVYCLAQDLYTRNIYSGGYDGSVIVFDPSSRSALCTFSAHSESITSMACSLTGTDIATGSYDGLIRIWDNRSMACCKYTLSNAKNVSVSSVRFSENGRYLLASMFDDTHILYDMFQQNYLIGGDPSTYKNSSSNNSNNNNKSHSIDALYGMSAFPPKPIKRYTGHKNSRYSIFSDFYECIYGKYIISGSEDGKVYMWNLGNRQISRAMPGHSGTVFAVAGRPSSDELPPQIASGGDDGQLVLWDLSLLNKSTNVEEEVDVVAEGGMSVGDEDRALRDENSGDNGDSDGAKGDISKGGGNGYIGYSSSNDNHYDDNSMSINHNSSIDNGTHSSSNSNINDIATNNNDASNNINSNNTNSNNINSSNNNNIVSECMDTGENNISNNEVIVNSDC